MACVRPGFLTQLGGKAAKIAAAVNQEGKLNYARPRTRQQPQAVRSLRLLARNAVVASTSLGVLALLVLFALAAPSAELTAEVGPVVPRPGSQAVVEGRVVDANGSGLAGAKVAVLRRGGDREVAESGEDGAFRVVLRGGCSRYIVSVRAEANGDDVETASTARLCPGDSLPVDARVRQQGHFLWVPGPR